MTERLIVTLIDPYNRTQKTRRGEIILSAALPKSLTRKDILKELAKQELIQEDMLNCSLVTIEPRNYYLDLVLSEGEALYYDEAQVEGEQQNKSKRIIQLPFSLEIAKLQIEWMIDCQTDIIGPRHFEIIQKIGEGTYSQIFLVQRRYDRHLFCMKRINKADCREKGSLEMIKNEFEILQYSSKYKIKLYYEFEDLKYVYFILEYCPFGDLFGMIRSGKKQEDLSKMSLAEKYTIWIEIAFGIVSLHEKGLVYRDLKPQNILIDLNERVKICDFGFACKIGLNEKLNTMCGSFEYLAPEVIKKEGYDKSVDLYCLGLLFYQLLVGANPFEGTTPKSIMEMKGKPINFQKKQISLTVKDLLKKLLKDKPEERLGYEHSLQIFRHQFFKQNEEIVKKIIKGEAFLKSVRFSSPPKQEERMEIDQKEVFVFPKGAIYNYLTPFFDVTENVGPKFQSG